MKKLKRFHILLTFFLGFACMSSFVSKTSPMQRLMPGEQAFKFSLCGECNKPLDFKNTLISPCQHAFHKQCFDERDESCFQYDDSTECSVCDQILIQRISMLHGTNFEKVLEHSIGSAIKFKNERGSISTALSAGIAAEIVKYCPSYCKPSDYYSLNFAFGLGIGNVINVAPFCIKINKAVTLARECQAPVFSERMARYRNRFIGGSILVSLFPFFSYTIAQMVCDKYQVSDSKASFVTTGAALVGFMVGDAVFKNWAIRNESIPKISFKPSVQ